MSIVDENWRFVRVLVGYKRIINPRRHRARGRGDAPPMSFFSELAAEAQGELRWKFAPEFLRHPLRNFWQEKWRGQIRSQRYGVIGVPTADRFFTKVTFSAVSFVAIGWNEDIMRDLGQKMTTSVRGHCIVTFSKVIWNHRPVPTLFLSIVGNLSLWGFLRSWDRM